mmetsp:Transcript_18178/g.50168  ORF Transcript_18178/g.50168 Transcript_18178/m.50168 type:complete len:88 (-) Transcript_18178:340-603(-)
MCRSNTVTRMVASWHETHDQKTLARVPDRMKAREAIQTEIDCQRLELLKRRSQKLRELYDEEAQMYARELRSLGLVIFNKELPPKVC